MSISVIHDQDGHVDDLLTCLLLWLSPEIDLQAVGITNGDCYVDQAFQSMLKIATFLDLEGAEIALSEDAVPNPFPEFWRRESFIINELPLFRANDLKKPYEQGRPRKSSVVFADCLTHSRLPLTVVTTGPLTNIAGVLKAQPKLADKVSEFVIVGGALSGPGNVIIEGQNGLAEWNIYADPPAFKSLLETKAPIKLIPLDVTRDLTVNDEFLRSLSAQAETRMASQLAAALWSIVKGFQSNFCDMVAAAALIKPALVKFKDMRIDISLNGRNKGRLLPSFFSGRKVQVATEVDKAGFESLVLSVLNSR
jgi:purine nucleosidase